MAGLFLGRGSACNWCGDESSISESSISESSESVSSGSGGLSPVNVPCLACIDSVAPRTWSITVDADRCDYGGTFLLPLNGQINSHYIWDSLENAQFVQEPGDVYVSKNCDAADPFWRRFRLGCNDTNLFQIRFFLAVSFYRKQDDGSVVRIDYIYQTPIGVEYDCLSGVTFTRSGHPWLPETIEAVPA